MNVCDMNLVAALTLLSVSLIIMYQILRFKFMIIAYKCKNIIKYKNF